MTEYYMKRDEQVFGPYTAEQLKDAAITNTLKPHDEVANSSAGPWVTASTVPALDFPPPSTQPEAHAQPATASYQLNTGVAGESVTAIPSPSPQRDTTVVIHQVFNNDPQWPLTQAGIPVELLHSDDGNPVYAFDIEGIELVCFEITAWHDDEISRHSPRRLVIRTMFEGIEITNPTALLEGTHISRGFPSYGMNEDGVMSMQIAIPISPEIPISVLRGQVLASIGIIVEESVDFWNAVGDGGTRFSAERVAHIVGILLGGVAKGFFGIR